MPDLVHKFNDDIKCWTVFNVYTVEKYSDVKIKNSAIWYAQLWYFMWCQNGEL